MDIVRSVSGELASFDDIMGCAYTAPRVTSLLELASEQAFTDGFLLATNQSVGRVRAVMQEHQLIPHQVCKGRRPGTIWVSLVDTYRVELDEIRHNLHRAIDKLRLTDGPTADTAGAWLAQFDITQDFSCTFWGRPRLA